MYSKPRGMYIKHRDKPARRLSPRGDNYDADFPIITHSEDERYSPRVDVEHFGAGEISAETEPQWPRRNFEEEDNVFTIDHEISGLTSSSRSAERISGSSKMEEHVPSRAQQYVVKTESYRELTGAKYITVPEPKDGKKKHDNAPRSRGAASIKSYGPTASVKSHQTLSASRTSGHMMDFQTMRGNPNHLTATKSHIATIRLPSKKHMKPGKRTTLRAIQRDGTVRNVKGYHVGQNATVRVHNTGHDIRHLKNAMSSWDRTDGGFKRSTFLTERKEYYITQFAIELDKPEVDSYSPGEFLSGRVILEASANIEIRFVELLILGAASIQFNKKDPSHKNTQEVLINKRSYMMGKPDGRWNSVITAGKYVSKFKFRLPSHLPSTHRYSDKEHGFNFEIGYMVKARICDEIGSSSTRSTHSINNYVKVLLTRRFPFLVRMPFDLHSIPNALQAVRHSEYVNLSCIPIFMSTTNLVLSLDRAVFLAGDEIRVKLTTAEKTSRKIKSLHCELHQRVYSKANLRPHLMLVQIQDHQPEGISFIQDSKNYVLYEYSIPTHAQYIPSFMRGTSLLRVSYMVVMTIKFKSCSQVLMLECPVAIGPCADPMSPTENTAVPVFNRPKRFPNFSRESNHKAPDTPKELNGSVQHLHKKEPHMVAPLKSQGVQLFCCCLNEETI